VYLNLKDYQTVGEIQNFAKTGFKKTPHRRQREESTAKFYVKLKGQKGMAPVGASPRTAVIEKLGCL